jgi:hypothetical protein
MPNKTMAKNADPAVVLKSCRRPNPTSCQVIEKKETARSVPDAHLGERIASNPSPSAIRRVKTGAPGRNGIAVMKEKVLAVTTGAERNLFTWSLDRVALDVAFTRVLLARYVSLFRAVR